GGDSAPFLFRLRRIGVHRRFTIQSLACSLNIADEFLEERRPLGRDTGRSETLQRLRRRLGHPHTLLLILHEQAQRTGEPGDVPRFDEIAVLPMTDDLARPGLAVECHERQACTARLHEHERESLARRRKGADGSPSPLSLDGVRRWEDLHLGRDAEVPRHLEDPLVLRAVTEESEPPVRVVVSNPPEGAYEVHEALRTDE